MLVRWLLFTLLALGLGKGNVLNTPPLLGSFEAMMNMYKGHIYFLITDAGKDLSHVATCAIQVIHQRQTLTLTDPQSDRIKIIDLIYKPSH